MPDERDVQVERFPTPILIGVLADTHLGVAPKPLPEALVSSLGGVDLILHAGDVCTAAALELFLAIGPPVRAVVGNNDSAALHRLLPRERVFRFGHFTAGMIHGHDVDRLTARKAAEQTFRGRVDLGIFGHSHRVVCERVDGLLLVNPGPAMQRRWEPHHSLALLRIDQSIDVEIRVLPY